MGSTKTREDLKRDGYTLKGYETCRGPHCHAMMEIWKKEGAKVLVMDPVGIFQSHFVTCPDWKMFRRKKAPAGHKRTVAKSGNLF
jgi:hypothetical protein